MCEFKVGDIVKSKDDLIFRISQIGYCGLAIYGNTLVHNIKVECRDEEVKKVTFYEMLDFIKANDCVLYIELNFNMVDKIHTLVSNMDEDRKLLYGDDILDAEDKTYYMCYYQKGKRCCDKQTIILNLDNLDFDFDLKEIEVKEKMNELLNIFEDNFKDAFKKVIVYGEEVSFNDILDRLKEQLMPKIDVKPFVQETSFYNNWKPNYINIFNMDKAPKCIIVAGNRGNGKTKTLKEMYEDKMTERKERELKDKIDTVNYWYMIVKEMLNETNKPELKEDEVFVNNKKKTTVIKWADGELTKATCDKDDKYDLEKGVMVAMLKKYYTVDEINSFIEKAKESQERDKNKHKEKENKKVKEEKLNESKKKKEDIDLDDLPF